MPNLPDMSSLPDIPDPPLDIPATFRQMGRYLPGVASTNGIPLDLVAHPTGYQLGTTAPILQEIAQRAARLSWSEAQVMGHMQRRCRWPGTVKQLSLVPEDWLWECVAALDRMCWPQEVAALEVQIWQRLQRLGWTIADAIEYCCANGAAEGQWHVTDPIIIYTRQSQRLDRLGLEQLQQLADALEGCGGRSERVDKVVDLC